MACKPLYNWSDRSKQPNGDQPPLLFINIDIHQDLVLKTITSKGNLIQLSAELMINSPQSTVHKYVSKWRQDNACM